MFVNILFHLLVYKSGRTYRFIISRRLFVVLRKNMQFADFSSAYNKYSDIINAKSPIISYI